jgi:hypothetical protein
LFDLAFFALVACLCFAAWQFKTYRNDPDVESLYRVHRHSDETTMRDQVIGNRFDALRYNETILDWKRARVRDASWTLIAAFIVLAVLVVTNLFV